MTRKRFIKLLMSNSVERNIAQKIAADYNVRNIPYENAIKRWRLEFSMTAAFAKLSNSAIKAARAFSECVCLMKNIDSNLMRSDTE